MSSLLLVALLASATDVAALEELTIEAEAREATVRIAIQGAPSFTTSEAPGLYTLDFVDVKSSIGDVEDPGAPGLLAIRAEPRPEGLRLQFHLEPRAQAELRMDDGALAIRVFTPAVEDPAEEMRAAFLALAAEVAKIREALRQITFGVGEEAPADEAPQPASDAPAHAAEDAGEDDADTVAEAADVDADPVAGAVAGAVSELVEEAPPEPAVAAEAVAEEVASVSAELVRLGFRPTPTGATILVGLAGESAHRLERREGLVVLELPGTRVRRANDKRPLDATYFGTPVGTIRAVEDREAAVTRIEIELLRPAEITVDRLEDEISVALAEAAER